MRSGGQWLASGGAAERVKSGMVVRRRGRFTVGPRAIPRASILPRRPKSLLRQHCRRKAPSHSSRGRAPGRANASGSRFLFHVDPAKPPCEAREASCPRGFQSVARRPDCWHRLRKRSSPSLSIFSMEEALRRRSALPDAWTIILGQHRCLTSVKFLNQREDAGIGSACESFGKLPCGWVFLHLVDQDRL